MLAKIKTHKNSRLSNPIVLKVIKDTYNSLKKRKLFGDFKILYEPLGDKHDCGSTLISIGENVFLRKRDEESYDSFPYSISLLDRLIRVDITTFYLKFTTLGSKLTPTQIKEYYTEDYFSEYKNVIPNNLVHGFTYGFYMICIGTILMFILMVYMLSIEYTAIVFLLYSTTLKILAKKINQIKNVIVNGL